MKEIELAVTCSCGFWKQRIFYTNEYGYFEISNSYCPNCFNMLTWTARQLPTDTVEVMKENDAQDLPRLGSD